MTPPVTGTGPLVLVVAGTDHHPFDRLVGYLDEWLAQHPGAVRCLVQYGASAPPLRADGVALLSHDDLQAAMAEATVVVTHGGPATITEARSYGHVPICVPRDPSRGEHVDDHQQRFARHLADAGLVVVTPTAAELGTALDVALEHHEDHHERSLLRERERDASRAAVGRLVWALTRCHRLDQADGSASRLPPHPDVDVVIATRDRPQLLRAAIASIVAQDYPGDIHVIVVFDQLEPDRSIAVDDPHRRVTVTSNVRTPGLAGARNSGILLGTAELVAFCDDDDRWLPDKLKAQVAVLRDDPEAALVSCGVRVRYGETVTDRVLTQDRVDLHDLLRSRVTELHPSTFVLRRPALINGFGLVSEDIPGSYAEDYELLLRAAQWGTIRSVPAVGTEVLWHRSSYFTARWQTISEALSWLLERHPVFRAVPSGHARVRGQIAFAEAAQGHRRAALEAIAATLRASPREPRAYLALAVASGLVRGDQVLDRLQRHGRSV